MLEQLHKTHLGVSRTKSLASTLMLFVRAMHKEGLVLGIVKSYLVVVRYENINRGMGDTSISVACLNLSTF